MDRIQEEKQYWNKAAQDPEVDMKYICDLDTGKCLEAIGELEGKVLEIGCGVGRLMKDGYCGIDISEKMLEIARKRKPNCEFKLTDGRSIPYEDNTFDSVYSMLVFQHLPIEAVETYIKEVRRVLKENGVFIFQYIRGKEDAPFSKHHSIIPRGFSFHEETGLVHPQWTWVHATKI